MLTEAHIKLTEEITTTRSLHVSIRVILFYQQKHANYYITTRLYCNYCIMHVGVKRNKKQYFLSTDIKAPCENLIT